MGSGEAGNTYGLPESMHLLNINIRGRRPATTSGRAGSSGCSRVVLNCASMAVRWELLQKEHGQYAEEGKVQRSK